jgi:hypothetical protein
MKTTDDEDDDLREGDSIILYQTITSNHREGRVNQFRRLELVFKLSHFSIFLPQKIRNG